jgi:hypothetical protein
MMTIYEEFYKEFGGYLYCAPEEPFSDVEYRVNELLKVTMQRGNCPFFDNEEEWQLYNGAVHNGAAKFYDHSARMVRNVAEAYKKDKTLALNLVYGMYVVTLPIRNCRLREETENFKRFCNKAFTQIEDILKITSEAGSEEKNQDEDLTFEGENFSDENIKLFVVVVERIINQVGVDELNSSVEKHYSTLSDSRKAYSKKATSRDTVVEHNIDSNTYGRYTVTRKSIQAMAPICNQTNTILEPIDKFYKEKFDSLGKDFDKANATIHAISSFCGLWGLGTWKLSGMFSTKDSDATILEKIQLGEVALATCTTAGKIINGGAHLLKIIDWAMPYFKKSKKLVRLNEKVWNLTRQDIQIPYIQKMMDQYMMEHYELKYGMSKGLSPYFKYYHSVATTIEDNHQRRAFENSVFAAETFMTPQNYSFSETDPIKNRAICCGVFLNLVRSGMCSKQDIEAGTANDIVDKLYNIYISKENVTPRVDISPEGRTLR